MIFSSVLLCIVARILSFLSLASRPSPLVHAAAASSASLKTAAQRQPEGATYPACRIAAAAAESAKASGVAIESQRIVAIGDVHGELGGLVEVLNMAGIVDGQECVWTAKPQPAGGTLLVQVGDIVDRGPSANEVWDCLKALQDTAPSGSEVVRLVGNHDIWWLEGYLRDRNPQTDTKERVTSLVKEMKTSILKKKVRGAFHRKVHGVDLLFSHSGFRTEMKDLVLAAASPLPAGTSEAHALAEHTNKLLFDAVKKCSHEDAACKMRHEVFEAGPERGGSSIGGPFWTDFSVLQAEEQKKTSDQMIQIFGHTASRNLDIRATPTLSAFCVDAWMLKGGRSFLELASDGHFRVYSSSSSGSGGRDGGMSRVVDLTEAACPRPTN